MDDKLLEFLLDKNVPTFSMASGLSLGDFGWGSPTFHKMGREKVRSPAGCTILCTRLSSWSCFPGTRLRRHTASTVASPPLCPGCPCLQINLLHSFTQLGFSVLISGMLEGGHRMV